MEESAEEIRDEIRQDIEDFFASIKHVDSQEKLYIFQSSREEDNQAWSEKIKVKQQLSETLLGWYKWDSSYDMAA